MKNRRLFQLATAVTTIMGIAAACSFPEPRIVDDGDGGNGTDGGGDVIDPTNESGADAPVDGGGGGVELDAPPSFDATSEKPPVDAAGCFCDCDKDGYRSADQDAMACGDAAVQAGDCDDLDPRAHPDAGFVYDLPTQDTKGDWNCDTKYTLEYQLSLKCSEYDSFLGAGCARNGFQAQDIGCGIESNTWVSCTTPAIAGKCGTGTSEKRVQGCK